MNPNEFENRYFIDGHRHNCPYCGVRSIGYKVVTELDFDWSNEKRVYIYITECFGCRKQGLHLTNFCFHSKSQSNCFSYPPTIYDSELREEYTLDSKGNQVQDPENFEYNPDDYFFYHRPFSKFSIDQNVPEKIRSLIEEAEGCKNQNYLVGASGALRKTIYQFLGDQKIPRIDDKGKEFSYEQRIKLLKTKYPKSEEEVFDALASIQSLTSGNLHESEPGGWEAWTSTDFSFVLEVVKSALYEVYASRKRILSMLDKVNKLKNKSSLSKQSEKVTTQ